MNSISAEDSFSLFEVEMLQYNICIWGSKSLLQIKCDK